MKRGRRARKRFWRITGQKKFDTFFEVTIPIGCITDAQLVGLLKCLSAKAESSFEDIVGAFVKKRTRRAHNYLEPRSSFPKLGYWWQLGDFSFVVAIVDEKGDRVGSPSDVGQPRVNKLSVPQRWRHVSGALPPKPQDIEKPALSLVGGNCTSSHSGKESGRGNIDADDPGSSCGRYLLAAAHEAYGRAGSSLGSSFPRVMTFSRDSLRIDG